MKEIEGRESMVAHKVVELNDEKEVEAGVVMSCSELLRSLHVNLDIFSMSAMCCEAD